MTDANRVRDIADGLRRSVSAYDDADFLDKLAARMEGGPFPWCAGVESELTPQEESEVVAVVAQQMTFEAAIHNSIVNGLPSEGEGPECPYCHNVQGCRCKFDGFGGPRYWDGEQYV